MGSSLKANAVRDLIKLEHTDFLLLQETKITDQEFQNSMKRSRNYEGIAMSAMGASGGIGTIWDKSKWKLKDHKQNRWWIRDKASCWESISLDLLNAQGRNIFLGGDLNLIRSAEEKMGGNFYADPSREALEEIIQTHNLVDIPPKNGRFTWSNKRTGKNNIKERLDRILVQERTVANFPRIQSTIIQGFISDHKPVALQLDKGENMGPLPFKYNKTWDSREDFRNLVKDQWARDILGSPHFIWETKLKLLRTAIKQWARQYAVEQGKQKSDLQAKLNQWSQEKENIQVSEDDQRVENELYKEMYNQN
eukprot:PITA_32993